MKKHLWHCEARCTRCVLLSMASTGRALLTRALLIIVFGTGPLGGDFVQRPHAQSASQGARAGEVICNKPDLGISADAPCCSDHGGICGCQNHLDLCCDGTVVACGC